MPWLERFLWALAVIVAGTVAISEHYNAGRNQVDAARGRALLAATRPYEWPLPSDVPLLDYAAALTQCENAMAEQALYRRAKERGVNVK